MSSPILREILIIEDQPEGHRLLQGLVRHLCEPSRCDHASDLQQAESHLYHRHDLVLCDLRLPDGLSLDWIARYRRLHPEAWLVVSTLYDDDELVFASLRAGADGYLLKTDPPELLRDTLDRLLHGEPPMSPTIARKVLVHFRQGAQALPHAPSPPRAVAAQDIGATQLTPREQEVLGLIAQGLSAKMVAAELQTSRYTVNDQIKSIYRKLGIRNRVEATAQAVKLGLIRLD